VAEPVVTEVLAGARSDARENDLRRVAEVIEVPIDVSPGRRVTRR
jgi:hypothetical protein